MAEQDYLDKRWAKTGCKPLNKQTKNALVVTDFVLNPDEKGVVRNIQELWFRNIKLQEYKWTMSTTKSNKSANESKKQIIPITVLRDFQFYTELGSDPNNYLTIFQYDAYSGFKGACSQKGYKGMIFTVYLLKERNDKKPYKWLQFQSTGKGTDSSI